MTEQLKAEAYVRSQILDLMELREGCVFKNQYGEMCTVLRTNRTWNEEQKESETYDYSCQERNKETLSFHRSPAHPFWVIIGHQPQLQDWLAVLGGIKSKRTFGIDEDGECFADRGYDRNYVCKFNLTTGQPATEADYKLFNDIVSI